MLLTRATILGNSTVQRDNFDCRALATDKKAAPIEVPHSFRYSPGEFPLAHPKPSNGWHEAAGHVCALPDIARRLRP